MKHIKLFGNFLNENRIKDTTTVMSHEETEQFILDKLKQNPKYFDNVVYRGYR